MSELITRYVIKSNKIYSVSGYITSYNTFVTNGEEFSPDKFFKLKLDADLYLRTLLIEKTAKERNIIRTCMAKLSTGGTCNHEAYQRFENAFCPYHHRSLKENGDYYDSKCSPSMFFIVTETGFISKVEGFINENNFFENEQSTFIPRKRVFKSYLDANGFLVSEIQEKKIAIIDKEIEELSIRVSILEKRKEDLVWYLKN